ncbi:MAG: ATP-binding cassette domain-containing protein [Deltaproteobacteria bacterium]
MKSSPIIEAHELTRDFKTTRAVDSLELSIQPGELFGLVGPDGAGKTTTLRLFAGLLKVTSGSASVAGFDLASQAETIKPHVGYMAQQFSLYAELTVLENLHFFAEIFDVKPADMPKRTERLLSFAGLIEFKNRRAANLSGGMQKKLALACTLIHQPEILLLDEPNNHLDIQGRKVLEEALQAYRGTICLVTHDRHLINAVANKVLVIANGKAETFHGNYDDFQSIWKKRLQSPEFESEPSSERNETTVVSKKSKEQKRLEAIWRNELSRLKAPLTQQLDNLEQIIEGITSRLEELNHLLAQPDTYENGTAIKQLNLEYTELKSSLEEHNRQWEETAIELEALEESFWQDKDEDSTIR